jgi:hypothetical protein
VAHAGVGLSPKRLQVPLYCSGQLKSDVQDAGLPSSVQAQPAFLKNFQHRDIFRQDFGDEFLKLGVMGDGNEVPHQCPTESLPLILIEHGEGDLGPPRLHDDVAASACDRWMPALFQHGNQGHVADEVHIGIERDFLLGKVSSHGKEAAMKSLRADAAEGVDETVPIIGSDSANFDALSIAQHVNYTIIGGIDHVQKVSTLGEPMSGLLDLVLRVWINSA